MCRSSLGSPAYCLCPEKSSGELQCIVQARQSCPDSDGLLVHPLPERDPSRACPPSCASFSVLRERSHVRFPGPAVAAYLPWPIGARKHHHPVSTAHLLHLTIAFAVCVSAFCFCVSSSSWNPPMCKLLEARRVHRTSSPGPTAPASLALRVHLGQ
eukprot:scaffold3210_cov402-Prasinococcus_capsulatus_cf.AAC.7